MLLKIVKSNYSKNEKLKKVSKCYKHVYEKYSTLRINNQIQEEELNLKDNQLNNLDDALKIYETENYDLKLKMDDLAKRRSLLGGNEGDLSEGGDNSENNSLNEVHHFTNPFMNVKKDHYKSIRVSKSHMASTNAIFKQQEKITQYEYMIETLTKEKEELNEVVETLRQNSIKKDEQLEQLNLEILSSKNRLKELELKGTKLKQEKNTLQMEIECLKKDKQRGVKLIEDINRSMRRTTSSSILKDYQSFTPPNEREEFMLLDREDVPREDDLLESNENNLQTKSCEKKKFQRQFTFTNSHSKSMGINSISNGSLWKNIRNSQSEGKDIEEDESIRVTSPFSIKREDYSSIRSNGAKNTNGEPITITLNYCIDEQEQEQELGNPEQETTLANILEGDGRLCTENSVDESTGNIVNLNNSLRKTYSKISLTQSLDSKYLKNLYHIV
jgi:hypothetical protein